MADKYPSISPYAYCAWNPVKLVDPDGREGICVINGNSIQVKIVVNYSQKEMDDYLKKIDYNYPNAFKEDFENYFQKASGEYVIDGNTYDVQFDISFYNIDESKDGPEKTGAVNLKFDMGNNNSNHKENTITMGNSPRLNTDKGDFRGSFAHELLHSLGLPDTKDTESGWLSSYSFDRKLSSDEISIMLTPCIQFAKQNEISNGKILITCNRHTASGNYRNPPVLIE